MLSIMERETPFLRICKHLGILHLTEIKGKDREQSDNSDPRAPLML